jgi:CHAT domain-containing protein
MKRFYQNHLELGMTPVQALRESQLWLRDATRKDLGSCYKQIGTIEALRANLEITLNGDPAEKPYAEPFFWAAFTFTGA